MYVAVKGGERAIERSWDLLSANRRGDESIAELGVDQIREQLRLAVASVMTEGSVYDEELAALAIKQSAGDLVEAISLLRAYRTTLPCFGYTVPLDTEAMLVERRISAAFKDIPGGQVLGGTYDYTQRLLDKEGLIEQEKKHADAPEPGDLSREPLMFPVERPVRLQNLARADEGFLLAVGYATQRGYANSHPFAGEIRYGEVAVELELEELGFAVEIGDIDITECQMINQFAGSGDVPPTFTQGYGLAFGHSERKAMAMALVDRALRAPACAGTG
ncbi:MAG: Alpha-D-ribose 1-methylphosphonate 5-triphosphate synthase subunit PhnI (EC [uncultured Caballeronia sp.]|nr:MAG: Alpha-D-ribose 1-methylphosphonate 5-triphosphate synthase subunit PhnI (EC [uncultured Caballeronia sp.]